jgi:hypothetical protein
MICFSDLSIHRSNTNEGANWSAELPNPNANTSSPKATQLTVYNFLAGQYNTFTNQSFQAAIAQYYPLSDYNGSFSLQGQQMYGEMRFICTAVLVAGAVQDAGLDAYQYQSVFVLPSFRLYRSIF